MGSLKDIYYNVESGFNGIDKLYRQARSEGLKIKREDVKEFLDGEDVYQQFMKKEEYNSYIADEPLDEFQIDLIYMKDLSKNDFSYVLTCIDICTRVGDAEPVKTKGAEDVLEAFKKIIQRIGKPKQIYADSGSEWKGVFGKYLTDNDIKSIFVLTHAPYVERFNQTLKNMLFKAMTVKGYGKWRDILPQIVQNYNNSYHRVIKMSPNEAKYNAEIAVENTAKNAKTNQRDKIKEGDHVRIVKKQNQFTKSYIPKYENKQYIVENVDDGFYYLHGYDNPLIRSNIRKFKPVEDVVRSEIPDEGELLSKAMRVKGRLRRFGIDENNIINTVHHF